MRSIFRFAVVGFLWSLAALATAENAVLKTEISGLLTAGWSGDDAGLARAEACLSRAKAAAPQDARPLYAFALAQLKCRKFKEARVTLDKLIEAFPNEISARQTDVWLLAYLKDYPATLAGLSALSSHLPKEEGSSDREGASRDTAKFLGRMYGFLTGPAPDSLPDSTVGDSERQVREGLSSARRLAFDDGRQEVLKKFSDMQGEKKTTQEIKKADEAKQKEADLAKITAERASVKTERAALEQQANSAKAEFESEERKLQNELKPFKADYDRLVDRAKPLLRKIQDAQNDADRKESQAKNEKDKNKAQQLRNDANRIRDSIKNEKNEYDRLQNDARRVQVQASQVEAKLNAVGQQYRGMLSKLVAANNQLAQKERVMNQREREDNLPASGETGGVRALEAKLGALATYVPLILEEEKQRLLDSLEKDG